ncbi:hypothetical protein IWQ60_001828 [Tieghemiomyces parasiticus]|uniref:Yeast cell wall synthesis Kre9/Knh1-like N-terminal domain-containing protein n=1 Tax=Tieghemiomyces parasiticus TaxID=78921 RepID=A0A9W8AKH5_9FUNG|nr:hypothetical protein IWQ60_001828 [Tieghemiomyces parasiticus]
MKSYTISSLAIAFAALTSVSQAYFYTTSIDNSSTWKSGEKVTVNWIAKPDTADGGEPAATYSVMLKTGNDSDQQDIAQVVTNASIDKKSFTFTVPSNVPAGAYFLQFESGPINNWSTRSSVDGSSNWTPLGTGAEAKAAAAALANGGTVPGRAIATSEGASAVESESAIETGDSETEKTSVATATATATATASASASVSAKTSTGSAKTASSSATSAITSKSASASASASKSAVTSSASRATNSVVPTGTPDEESAAGIGASFTMTGLVAALGASFALNRML